MSKVAEARSQLRYSLFIVIIVAIVFFQIPLVSSAAEVAAGDITDITFSNTYKPGDTVQVYVHFTNPTSTPCHYLVAVQIFDPSDNSVYDSHPAGEDRHGWVSGGASPSWGPFRYTLPSDAPPGQYHVLASLRLYPWDPVLDWRGLDWCPPEETFQVEGLPDLRFFIGLSANPMSVNAGSDTVLSFSIFNGSIYTITSPIYIRSYLSTGSTITTGDSYLEKLIIYDDLGPWEGYEITNWHVTIPQDTFDTRNYYIGIILDPSDDIEEMDETNNTDYAYPFHVESRPDLTVTSVSAQPMEVTAGTDELEVTYNIQNIGYGSTGSFDNKIVLSEDTTIGDGDDIDLMPFGASSLLPGSSVGGTKNPTIPPDVEGYYYVGVIADTSGIPEILETNNTGRTSSKIEVVPPDTLPDLVVSYLSPQVIYVDSGETFSISTRVENQGSATAGSSTLGWYISSSPFSHGSLIRSTSVGSLDAGSESGTITESFNYECEGGEPWETVYIFTRANRTNNVEESEENNNYSDDNLSPGYVTVDCACIPEEVDWSFAVITDLHIGKTGRMQVTHDYSVQGWEDDEGVGEECLSTFNLRTIIREINSQIAQGRDIRFVVITGDLTDSGEQSEFNKAIGILNSELTVPWIPIPGNHDIWPFSHLTLGGWEQAREDEAGQHYSEAFAPQYTKLEGGEEGSILGMENWIKPSADSANQWLQCFSFDYGGKHLVFLDFNSRERNTLGFPGSGVDGELYLTWSWLLSDIIQYIGRQPTGVEDIILFSHHPFILELDCFDDSEIAEIEGGLLGCADRIWGQFAGHTHRNRDSILGSAMVDTGIGHVIELDTNNGGPLILSDQATALLVDIAGDGSVSYTRITQPTEWPEMDISSMELKALCPVGLVLTDPEGLEVSRYTNEIPGAMYVVHDTDQDGDDDDIIYILEPKIGNYHIDVVPDADALPSDTYTLQVTIGSDTTVLADNVQISDIPDQGYTIRQSIAPGLCFIATAAYGTPMAKEVESLREFRDTYLLVNPIGQALASIYYRISPPIAEFIVEHPELKPIVRIGLVPAVAVSTIAVHITTAGKIAIIGLLVLVSVAVAIWVIRRRRRGPEYA